MSIEGIYRVEMAGSYGREEIGTAFLEGGRYLEGGTDHYAVGSYTHDGAHVSADVTMYMQGVELRQGRGRTLFGKTAPQHALRFDGEVEDDQVVGAAVDEDAESLVRYRATKLADLT